MNADDEPVRFSDATRWLTRVSSYPAALAEAPSSVAVVVDDFAYDLHLGDVAHTIDVHEGVPYRSAAVEQGVDVYVVDGVDPRRSPADALDEAARNGRLLGARVAAYGVDRISD